MNSSKIGNRFKRFLTHLKNEINESPAKVGESIGITSQGVYKIRREGTVPGKQTLLLLEHIYGLNTAWLLHGRGEMFKEKNSLSFENRTLKLATRYQEEKIKELEAQIESLKQKLQQQQRESVHVKKNYLTKEQYYACLELLKGDLTGYFLGEILTMIFNSSEALAKKNIDMNQIQEWIMRGDKKIPKKANQLMKKYLYELLELRSPMNVVKRSA